MHLAGAFHVGELSTDSRAGFAATESPPPQASAASNLLVAPQASRGGWVIVPEVGGVAVAVAVEI
jgi:hypothetical protein